MLRPLLVVLSYIFACQAQNNTWSYLSGDPNKWPQKFPESCAGVRQSPIDIVVNNAVYNSMLGHLNVTYDTFYNESVFQMRNDGFGLDVSINPTNNSVVNPATLNQINFKGTRYSLAGFHFHWGAKSDRGSEHKINGEPTALELHFVHYNLKYAGLNEAIRNPDGLLVWGILGKAGTVDNAGLQPLVQSLRTVAFKGGALRIPGYPLLSMLPEGAHEEYFTYPGSLTTPNCQESVTWVVSRKFFDISERQMFEFRELHSSPENGDDTALEDNFRPVQPLNNRIVERNFESAAEPDSQNNYATMKAPSVFVAFAWIMALIMH